MCQPSVSVRASPAGVSHASVVFSQARGPEKGQKGEPALLGEGTLIMGPPGLPGAEVTSHDSSVTLCLCVCVRDRRCVSVVSRRGRRVSPALWDLRGRSEMQETW